MFPSGRLRSPLGERPPTVPLHGFEIVRGAGPEVEDAINERDDEHQRQVGFYQEEPEDERAAYEIVQLPEEVLIVRAYLRAALPERYRGEPERVHQKEYRKVAEEEVIVLVAQRVAHAEEDE